MEIFIAKLLGIYFIIVSLIVITRRTSLIPAIKELLKNRPLLIALATVELAAGLALVLVFPKVSFEVPGIISLIGYVLIVEAIMYFSASQKFIRNFIEGFNIPQWYVVGGIVALSMGVYLTMHGFGFIPF